MTDAFTAARPEYRRALTFAASPLPLAAGEVAEYRRNLRFRVWTVIQLTVCVVPVVCLWVVFS